MKKLLLLALFLTTITSVSAEEYSIKDNNGKFGIVDKNGKYCVPPIYDNISTYSLEKDYYIMVKDGKKALYKNKTFEEIFPAKYDNYSILDNNYVSITVGDKCALFTLDGKQLTDFSYHCIATMPNLSEIKNKDKLLFVVYNKDFKCGVIDLNNKLLLPIEFDSVVLNKYYIVTTKDRKEGLFDRQGKKLYDPLYKKISIDMYYGRIKLFETAYRWKTHIIPEEDKVAYESLIDEVRILYKDGNAYISKNVKRSELGKYDGKIIKPTCESNRSYRLKENNNLREILTKPENGKFKLIDNRGNELSTKSYETIDTVGGYDGKYLKVTNGEYCTLLDINLNEIVTLKANDIEYINNRESLLAQYANINECEYLIIFTDNGYVPYDLKGNRLGNIVYIAYKNYIPLDYSPFSIITVENGKQGVLDNKGILVVPAIYDKIEFGTPKLLLTKDGKYQYYNLEKNKLSKRMYNTAREALK